MTHCHFSLPVSKTEISELRTENNAAECRDKPFVMKNLWQSKQYVTGFVVEILIRMLLDRNFQPENPVAYFSFRYKNN